MLGTYVFLLISAIPFIIPCYLIICRPIEILRGLVNISTVYISVIQLLWTVGYMLDLYIYKDFYSYILYVIALCLTLYVMYRCQVKIGIWLVINMIISLTGSIIWIKIDDSPFRYGFMASLGIIATPLAIVILSGYLQLSIWLFVKFQKWLNNDLQKEKVPLKQSITTYIKIMGFQVLLSVLLESVFIFYNVVVSSIAIILSIVVIFIVRNKLRRHYIFWILSWSGISFLALVVSYDFVPYDFSLAYEINQRRWDSGMFAIIGLAIYHVFLTIYYKMMEEDQMPEELE